MEKKTIGRFIAALRKANGLTQKDLAEKLNVSDKAVSRWERDETYPDLTLIPVIAEIFSVTADELLRGERINPEAEPAGERAELKREKQMSNLLNSTRTHFRVRSICSAGLGVGGIILAMICNFGFNRGYIGFFAACTFFLAAVILQAVFMMLAFSAIGQDYEGEAVSDCKKAIIQGGVAGFSVIAVLLACSLPLVIFPWDGYQGVVAETWFGYGLVYLVIATALCILAWWIVDSAAQDRGVYQTSEKQKKLSGLKKTCTGVTVVAMLLTLMVHAQLTSDASRYAHGTVFDNYEDFIAYMELEQDAEWSYGPAAPMPGSAVTYFDETGKVITEEEAKRREIKNADGEVVCEYIENNQQVVSMHYGLSDTNLPITTYTSAQFAAAQKLMNRVSDGFVMLYPFEALLGFLVYFILRKKVTGD